MDSQHRRGRPIRSRKYRPAVVSALVVPVLVALALIAPGAAGQAPARATSLAEPAAWAPPFGFPVDVAAAYRAPPHRYGAGHRGIDLRPSALTGPIPVSAPADGTVSFSGRVVDRPVITIRLDDRTLVSLEPVESELAVGAPVARGAVIGTLASGGHCGGECVHLGIRVDGEYANPTPFLLDRPILLPLGD